MKEKPIRGKVVFANLILVAMLVTIVGMLWQEQRTTTEIAVKSDSIRVVHNEISTVHHRITELAMRGETAMAWTDSDREKYDSLLAKTDTLLGRLTFTCKDYVNKEQIDSVRMLLHQKQEHLEWMMQTVMEHRQSDKRLLKKLPKATEKATEVKTIKVKKSGFAGLLGGKKDVTIAPSADARKQLNELNDKIAEHHEARNRDMKAYSDNLRASNGKLNKKIGILLNKLDAQTQKAINDKESRILEARTRTLWILTGVAILALVSIALLTLNIRRELKRRKKYQEERERLIAELKQSNDEKDELIKTRRQIIQTVTHELRTPLTVVLGNAEMIEDGEEKGSAILHAGVIGKEGKRMSAMVDSLLNYFRLDNSKEAIEAKPFEIKTIGDTLEMEFAQLAADKQLVFEVENNASGIVYGDEEKITMIGCNLLSNAIKFTKDGSVSLRMDYANDILTMQVEDTGTGISKDKQDLIFIPFERLGNAVTKDGFGLGLAIVKNLTDIMGGTITLDSEKGNGCKFTVRIPLKRWTESIEGNVEESADTTIYPSNVIVIDDSDVLLSTIKDILIKAGMNCDTCINADELVAKLRHRNYDMVLTDLKMSDMDGFEILDLLRTTDIGNSKTVPVIAVTASGTITEEELREAGFNGIVFKPFSKSDLINAVNKYAINDHKDIEPDLSALLAFGDEENVLKQLIEETTIYMDSLQEAANEKDMERISGIVHHLRSSWMLLKSDVPLKRLNKELNSYKGWNDGTDDVVREVLNTGKKIISIAKVRLEGVER